MECVLCFKQWDAQKGKTITGNGDPDFLSRMKTTVSFIMLLRTLVAHRQEEVLSPGHWCLGVWRERRCEYFVEWS